MIWQSSHRQFNYFGTSLAGIRTWILFKELGLCFDVGHGCPEQLKADTFCITHGHLDHASGIPYVVSQLAMNKKSATFYMPETLVDPMNEIMKMWQKIDDFHYPFQFLAAPSEPVKLRNNFQLVSVPTFHRVPSCGYVVLEKKKSLLPSFANFSREQIIEAKKQGQTIEQTRLLPRIAFSGDTKSEFLDQPLVRESQILIVESTFLDDERPTDHARKWGHLHLDEIVERIDELQFEKLILIHVSARYSLEQIKKWVLQKIPETHHDRVEIFEGR